MKSHTKTNHTMKSHTMTSHTMTRSRRAWKTLHQSTTTRTLCPSIISVSSEGELSRSSLFSYSFSPGQSPSDPTIPCWHMPPSCVSFTFPLFVYISHFPSSFMHSSQFPRSEIVWPASSFPDSIRTFRGILQASSTYSSQQHLTICRKCRMELGRDLREP